MQGRSIPATMSGKSAPAKTRTFGVCIGLVSGYFDSMQMTYTCAKDNPGITRGQTRDVVVKFLQDHPEDRLTVL